MYTLHFNEAQVNTLVGVLLMAQSSFPEPHGRAILEQLHEHLLNAPICPEEQGNGWGTPGPLGMLSAEVDL